MSIEIDPERIVITETVDGQPVDLMYVETWDGLYGPIGSAGHQRPPRRAAGCARNAPVLS